MLDITRDFPYSTILFITLCLFKFDVIGAYDIDIILIFAQFLPSDHVPAVQYKDSKKQSPPFGRLYLIYNTGK